MCASTVLSPTFSEKAIPPLRVHASTAKGQSDPCPGSELIGVKDLIAQCPELRPPLIEGLLRKGETANIVAGPKSYKSWLMLHLAICIATGKEWLGFGVHKGRVLIIDNELHRQTIAKRLTDVIQVLHIKDEDIEGNLFVDCLRGRLRDITQLSPYFEALKDREFDLIILDSWYRFLPGNTSENDNAAMAQAYNCLDRYASLLGAAFVLVHHTTKGNQYLKSVTDTGAGAGAMARAADTHMVMREHAEPNCVAVHAVARSWPPVDAKAWRWDCPLWRPADGLDPANLKKSPKREPKPKPKPEPKPEPPRWTPDRFVEEFVTDESQHKSVIIELAKTKGIGQNRADNLFSAALSLGKIHKWIDPSDGRKVSYSRRAQPVVPGPETDT